MRGWTATGRKGKDRKKKRKRKREKERAKRESKRDIGGKREKGRGGRADLRNRKREDGRLQEAGGGKQNCQGKPGQTLGFEVRWAFGRIGLLSRYSQNIFILQN